MCSLQSVILNGSKIISNSYTVLISCPADKHAQLSQQYYQLHQCLHSYKIKNSFWPPSCFRNLIFKRKLYFWARTKAEHSTFILRKELKNNTTTWQLLEVFREHESLLHSWRYLMKPAKKFIQITAHSQGALEKEGPGTLSGRLHHSRLPATNPVKWWI